MSTLSIGGPCAERAIELGRAELAAVSAEHLVPDVSTLVEGRAGTAVRLAALAELAGVSDTARFVHVASEDGAFTANLDVDVALAGGLVLFELDAADLPRAYGGPFRLLFVDTEDCSVNVKFLGRVEFLDAPGSHTAACSD